MTQQNQSSSDNRPKNYLGSALLFIGIFSTATIVGIVLFALFWTPFSVRYKVATFWCWLVTEMAKLFCGLNYEVEGLENVPANQAVIFLSNHQSAWETLATRVFLPIQTTVLKKELLYFPLWGWALILVKSIVIDRSNQRGALKKLVEDGTKCLNEGVSVVVFPEGTRAGAREVLTFNAGGAMLAHKSGFPVIPVVHNAGDFWSRYSFLKYPGTIKIKIGAPIETKGRKASEINAEAEAWVKAELAKM
jgi:1-acyl-sn-glycerol-3-phosphate acyltransferase